MQITKYINGLQPIISNLSLHRYCWLINYYRKGARNSRNHNNKKRLQTLRYFHSLSKSRYYFSIHFFGTKLRIDSEGRKWRRFSRERQVETLEKGQASRCLSRTAMTYDKKSHFRCTLRAVGHAC